MHEITAQQFAAQRSARRGGANPERMDVPTWSWLVGSRLGAYAAREHFGIPHPSSRSDPPGWCFDRMGCPEVALPDGSRLWIAGEHEDSYDPDFFIYNDVVVERPGGEIEIFGYPEDDFPPTDFHTATLDERRGCIWIVGSLGYHDRRRPGWTPVFQLMLDTFAIRAFETSGEAPGWIHSHRAELVDDGRRLVVSRGILQHESGELLDQIDDWSLDLDAAVWRRDTHRPFRRWRVRRVDGEPLRLFEMGMFIFRLRYGGPEMDTGESDRERLLALGLGKKLVEELVGDGEGIAERLAARFDPAVLEALYEPPVPFEREARDLDDDEADWWDNRRNDRVRLRVGAGVIRYIEALDAAEIRIEGALDPGLESAITGDLASKLASLFGVPCEAVLVGSD
jgi:hypothetical protein